jgi:hypothetical protein
MKHVVTPSLAAIDTVASLATAREATEENIAILGILIPMAGRPIHGGNAKELDMKIKEIRRFFEPGIGVKVLCGVRAEVEGEERVYTKD